MIYPKCSAAICQRGGRHCILCGKLTAGRRRPARRSRAGRYHTVAGNLRVKEVIIDDGTMRDRFVVSHNPEEAAPKRIREQLVTQLTKAAGVGRARRDRPGGGGVE